MTLSTVAEAAASGGRVSSWKLESSSTHICGSAWPASSRASSTSSAAGLMLPATTPSTPAALTISPARVVVVVLPLVPVMGDDAGLIPRAKALQGFDEQGHLADDRDCRARERRR